MIEQHLKKLGYKCKDKVTGFKGVITSISFELYGCVQCVVTPPVGKDGKQPDSRWFDIARVDLTVKSPVMELPYFMNDIIDSGKKGAAEKPAFVEGPQ